MTNLDALGQGGAPNEELASVTLAFVERRGV